jgi:hypothetical protein
MSDSLDPLVPLEWHRFERLTTARSRFSRTSCVYIQTDATRHPVRI